MSNVEMVSPAGLVMVPLQDVGMKQKIGWTLKKSKVAVPVKEVVKDEYKPEAKTEAKTEAKIKSRTDTQLLPGKTRKGK